MEEQEQPVYDMNYRPVYTPLPAETARFLKRFELNAYVDGVIQENKDSALVQSIYPFLEPALKEIAAYRTHFKINRPVALQCLVVTIARKCS
jgi:hypothetical protein